MAAAKKPAAKKPAAKKPAAKKPAAKKPAAKTPPTGGQNKGTSASRYRADTNKVESRTNAILDKTGTKPLTVREIALTSKKEIDKRSDKMNKEFSKTREAVKKSVFSGKPIPKKKK